MREVKTIYTCDTCRQEVPNEGDLVQVTIPYKSINTEGITYIRYRQVELCRACRKRYEDAVFNHFGIYTNELGSYSFEKKGE